MRLFVNINGIDLFYEKQENSKTIEVKAVQYNQKTKKYNIAICEIPEFLWKENEGFEQTTLDYLEHIILHAKEKIIEDAQIKSSNLGQFDMVKVGNKQIPVRKEILN